jgi:hypothetical protein
LYTKELTTAVLLAILECDTAVFCENEQLGWDASDNREHNIFISILAGNGLLDINTPYEKFIKSN